jgi:integrase
MRNPNGYGCVVDLGKHRRNRYAPRVRVGVNYTEDGKPMPLYKYLGYFDDRKLANICLANYNAQKLENIPEQKNHIIGNTAPIEKKIEKVSITFSYVYDGFIEYKKGKIKQLSKSAFDNYSSSFKRLSGLHNVEMVNITFDLLQKEINKNTDMSYGTMHQIKNLLKQIYEYAIRCRYVKEDISAYCDYEVKKVKKEDAHSPFTDEEVKLLWKNKDDYDVGTVLIMIYTGMRITEILTLTNDKIHLDEKYIIHGEKTEAGQDRVIPIHNCILPIIKERYEDNADYFIKRKYYARTRQNYYYHEWNSLNIKYGMNHKAHDTRYTCASLMKEYKIDIYYRKLIIGHAIKDITDGVYTKTTPERLVKEINRIKVSK